MLNGCPCRTLKSDGAVLPVLGHACGLSSTGRPEHLLLNDSLPFHNSYPGATVPSVWHWWLWEWTSDCPCSMTSPTGPQGQWVPALSLLTDSFFIVFHYHQSGYYLPHCLRSITATFFPSSLSCLMPLHASIQNCHLSVTRPAFYEHQIVLTIRSDPISPFSWDTCAHQCRPLRLWLVTKRAWD